MANRVAVLERELEQSRRESARQQALVRVAHRSLGLKAVPEATAKEPKEPTDRKGRRKRRPVVRALKAAQALRKTVVSSPIETVEQPLSDGMDPAHPA